MRTTRLPAEKQQVAEHVGRIPLLRGSTLEQLEELVAGAVLMRLGPGDAAALHGALARHAYLLLDGDVILTGFDASSG